MTQTSIFEQEELGLIITTDYLFQDMQMFEA
jgi:hypothetical protein